MRYDSLRPSVLAIGAIWLAACTNDTTTEPTSTAQPAAPMTELAVASNSWITRANMPTNRIDLAAATVTNAAGQSIVYAIGGVTRIGTPLSTVTAYNVATNTWTFRHTLPLPLAGSNGAGVINGKIYVSGGYSDYGGDFPRPSLYVYDPATNTWTQKRDIPVVTGDVDRYAAGRGVTGVINGKLYVVSGCFTPMDPWGYFELCNPLFFRYTPATDQWVRLPSPFAESTSVSGPSIGGVISGKFYVMARASFAVYDPATNRWTPRTPLGLPRPGAGSAVLGGKLYVVGGMRYNAAKGGSDTLDITIVYDPVTDAWTRRASLPSPRRGIAATKVFLNGNARIEVVGGNAPGNNIQYIP
jgi:N-acetylneuraminic acid mutarotase